ncbi:MAG: hypothetical protein KF716_18715 [Anaerolineae bacterium]|nr:hypothetical protein [Anaerolineae bacterium]
MSIQVRWDDHDHHIIYMDFDGKWSWSEFQDARRQVRVLADAVDYPVYFIIDFSEGFPPPPDTLRVVYRSMIDHPRNASTSVIVSQSAFVDTLYNIFVKAFPLLGDRLRLARNVEEARVILANLRLRADHSP